ncbi:hypothetical protein BASA81_001048 [Batrachochytrium salamandrivorans]|nr:hypothetical protein BASA81_001048 [Batrachochytrium salamandrivorans]
MHHAHGHGQRRPRAGSFTMHDNSSFLPLSSLLQPAASPFLNSQEAQSTLESVQEWLNQAVQQFDLIAVNGEGENVTEDVQVQFAFLFEQLSEILEAEEGKYFAPSETNRCPLINHRESFLVSQVASIVADHFIDQILPLMFEFIFPPPVEEAGLVFRLRVASARLVCLLLEILPNPEPLLALIPMDMLVAAVCLPCNTEETLELQMFQTGILGVALNDRKSFLHPDSALIPIELPNGQTTLLPNVLVQRIVALEPPSQMLAYSLRVLSFLGEYQEALSAVEEGNILDRLFDLLSLQQVEHEFLLFYCLELFSRLLVHKSFIQTFITRNGVQLLLQLAQGAKRPFFLTPTISSCFSCIAVVSSSLIERVFRNEESLKTLIKFHLALLRGEQDVTKKNALLFFSFTFAFPSVLVQFDAEGGCKTLLDILRRPNQLGQKERRTISVINLVKHTCKALREYFRAHFALAANLLVKNPLATSSNSGSTATPRRLSEAAAAATSTPKQRPALHSASQSRSTRQVTQLFNKPLHIDNVSHERNFEIVSQRKAIEYLQNAKWHPLEELLQAQGICLLFGLVTSASNSAAKGGGTNAEETCSLALQVLSMISLFPVTWPFVCSKPVRFPRDFLSANGGGVLPDVQGDLSSGSDREVSFLPQDQVGEDNEDDEDNDEFDENPFGNEETGISVLLRVAGGSNNDLDYHHTLDSKSTVFALKTLVHCVCPRYLPERQQEARNLARNNNAVMALLALLNYKEKPADADPIRFYACDALFGLSLDAQVADILTALNVDRVLTEIRNSEVVLAENVSFHSKLKAKALELLNSISPRELGEAASAQEEIAMAADAAARRIARDAIVRRSNVQWNQRELLLLIYEHLELHGCHQAAQTLKIEADLSNQSALSNNNSQTSVEAASNNGNWPARRTSRKPHKLSIRRPVTVPPRSQSSGRSLFMPATLLSAKRKRRFLLDDDAGAEDKKLRLDLPLSGNAPTAMTTTTTSAMTLPVIVPTAVPITSALGPSLHPSLLEKLVSDNLKHQHLKCPHPITTPPVFSLVANKPHHCPTAKPKLAPKDIGKRLLHRGLAPPYGGPHGAEFNTKFLHSKLRFLRPLGREMESPEFAYVAFRSQFHNEIVVGTETGQLYRYSSNSEKLLGQFDLQSQMEQYGEEIVSNLVFSPSGNHMVTETNHLKSAMVWSIHNDDDVVVNYHFKDARSAVLNPRGDSLVCFVKNHHVTPTAAAQSGVVFYSLETGQPEGHFGSSHVSNGYEHTNISMSREEGRMVCYDGVLWDFRLSPNRKIHKFDKLSKFGWSALHPNGYQLLLNKDVWDLRTYRIVQSCSNALDGSTFRFDPFGEVIYSYQDGHLGSEDDVGRFFHSNVVVSDGSDYSNIASWNMNQASVFDLDIHPNGQQVAVLVGKESERKNECRVYEIGRATPMDDDSDVEDRVEDEDMAFSEEEEAEDDEEDNHHLNDNEIVIEGEAFEHVMRAMRGANFHDFLDDDDEDDEDFDEEEEDDDGDEDEYEEDIDFGEDEEEDDF